ncbi:hypothetical protein Psta_2953 [Pirellula staleyi DSM 6068]|uniref:Uncharacterized protein n=1 Tax=Pirellula staleyi (strain ATCC 27377 / DSM 6068 / ICPB 4128) TaxID=530564 RepID=D2R8S7_PIRSD|nr:hypothetical protein [Pirellula staleyi]ADB17618.1 hypothetical protein Psta_2953 [Pirellula staleyi DSM 6068]
MKLFGRTTIVFLGVGLGTFARLAEQQFFPPQPVPVTAPAADDTKPRDKSPESAPPAEPAPAANQPSI